MGEFNVLFSGKFKPDQVEIERVGEISDPCWISEICEQEFGRVNAERRQKGQQEAINGPQTRLGFFSVSGERVHLELGLMNYMQYLGYRAISSTYKEHFGIEKLPKRLGNTSIVVLNAGKKDEKFLLTRRTSNVADYPCWIGAGAAGGIQTKSGNIFDGMFEELRREWGLLPKNIDKIVMTGAVYDLQAGNNCELTFASRTAKSPEDLEGLVVKLADEKWEHQERTTKDGKKQYGIYLDHDSVVISNELITNPKIMPTSAGAIALYGKINPFNRNGFGEEWFGRVMDKLREKWVSEAYSFARSQMNLSRMIDARFGLK